MLALTKPLGSIQPIVIGEVIYWMVNRGLCLQLQDTIFAHLSPHQFGVTVKGGCEAVVHVIQPTLDAHPDWVVLQVDFANALNIISYQVIFKKLCIVGNLLS